MLCKICSLNDHVHYTCGIKYAHLTYRHLYIWFIAYSLNRPLSLVQISLGWQYMVHNKPFHLEWMDVWVPYCITLFSFSPSCLPSCFTIMLFSHHFVVFRVSHLNYFLNNKVSHFVLGSKLFSTVWPKCVHLYIIIAHPLPTKIMTFP